MKIELLAGGLQALTAQAGGASPGARIIFDGFQLGTALGSPFNPGQNQAEGLIIFDGSRQDMRFSNFDSEAGLLTLVVDRNQRQGVIGNIVIFVRFNDVRYPFARVVPALNENNIKWSTNEVQFGMDLYVNIQLRIPNLMSRFDFTGLTTQVVQFANFATDKDVLSPMEVAHDCFMINGSDNHGGRPILGWNSFNQWWASPVVFHIGETNYGFIKGGRSGDGHRALLVNLDGSYANEEDDAYVNPELSPYGPK